MNKEERVFLEYFVYTMESQGLTSKQALISFSEEKLQEINKKYKTDISVEKMEIILNKLISREYIKRNYLGGGFLGLEITSKGVGIIISLRSKEESKKKRKFFKKISDYIEDHKGIFALVGILIAAIGLYFKY